VCHAILYELSSVSVEKKNVDHRTVAVRTL